MPHVGLPAKTVDRGGHGKRVVDAGQGRGSPGGCAGEVREGVEEGQGTDAGAGSARSRAGAGTTRAGAWWRRPGARRAVGGRSPGRGAQVLLTGALKILQRVRAASGGQCGKYLKESMPLLLDLLEGAGELDGEPRYGPAVRAELEAMSAATIDRYLAPAGARAVRGRSTTKAGPLLRSSIKIRRAGDEVEAEPGFFEVDTVAHCGPVLKGEFARTVEHDPMCSRGGPSPARSAGVADKAHHLGPRRRRGRDPVPRAGHGLRQRVGIHQPRRGAAGREPGASTLPPARAPTGRTTRPPGVSGVLWTWEEFLPATGEG